MLRAVILLVALAPAYMQAQKTIELADVFLNGTFSESSVFGLTHMPDGKHYCALDFERHTRTMRVIQYAYADTTASVRLSSALLEWEGEPVFFTNYTFGPKGRFMLLPTKTTQIYRYSSKSQFLIYDTETGQLDALADGAEQMYATFSPDGKKVAWVEANNLFYKDLATGRVVQVTEDGEWNQVINGASDWVYEEEFYMTRAYEWSPDSRFLAFLRFDESQVPEFEMPMYTANDLHPAPYRFKYPKAGETNAEVSLHYHTLYTNSTQAVDLGLDFEHYLPRLQWIPGSTELSFHVMNRHQSELRLLALNADNGQMREILRENSETYVQLDDHIHFLEGGKSFIWRSERDGYQHLYHYTTAGSLMRQLTKGEFDVTDIDGLDSRRGLVYFRSTEVSPMERHLYKVTLAGKRKQISELPGNNRAQFSATGDYYIRWNSSVGSPMHVAVFDRKSRLVRNLEVNGTLRANLTNYNLASKEFFSFKTEDDVTLNGWMMKPGDFNPSKKYPVLMFVYGGPGSQTVKNVYGGRNHWWFEYLTQLGYIVVSVDNRGTGGRGTAFKKCTYMKLGQLELIDQVASAKHLATLDFVDAKRIGIFGWSYGGYMSTLCMMHKDRVFKAGIAVAPVTHWKYYDTIYTERYMRTPQENEDGYEDGSPLNHAADLEGEYLLIHGTGDDNVHFQNTTALIEALIDEGKQFDLFVYPDRNHGLGPSKVRMHVYQKMTDFILENL